MRTISTKRQSFDTLKRVTLAILILYILAVLSSCEYHTVEVELLEGSINPCDTATVSFSTDVTAILTSKCATTGCHDGTGDDPNLSSSLYTNLESSLGDGKFKSKVIDQRTMPPIGSTALSNTEYMILKCWFENGHSNN
ncbi:MAG: hypothetical protein IPP56_08685 [Bacteroidetes bacterium]|nr:hypothetical protein [Bacteroidota bacterium]MBK9799786.1 hypothetical protein [Bacteroidota bacterium]